MIFINFFINMIQTIIDNFGEQFLINGLIISFIIGGSLGFFITHYFDKDEVDDRKDKNILD